MIIRRMTATFGKLDGDVLELKDGLNIIEAPNEFGKSTWSAFLITMLYGIDTTQRASKNSMPIKTKYKPWNGKSMAGTMEILWNDREITLERTSLGRSPMGNFKAYDTKTGEILDFLTGDTCGETVLGVERSVYERSGFIGQQSMAVTSDSSLEQRLSALVTTGEEDVSFALTEKRLRDLKNRRRHNRTGLLPQAEAQLAEVEQAIAEINQIGRQTIVLQEQSANQEKTISAIIRSLDYQNLKDRHEKQKQLTQAREIAEAAQAEYEIQAKKIAGLPPLEQLRQWEHRCEQLLFQEEQLEHQQPPVQPNPPTCPKGMEGLTGDQVRAQVAAHMEEYTKLEQTHHKAKKTFLILGLVAILTALVLVVISPQTAIGCVAAALVFAALHGKEIKKVQQAEVARQTAMVKILAIYGFDTKDATFIAAEYYRDEQIRYDTAKQVFQRDFSTYSDEKNNFLAEKTEFLSEMAQFSSTFPSLFDVKKVLSQLCNQHEATQKAAENMKQATAYATQLQDLLGIEAALEPLPAIEPPKFSQFDLQQAKTAHQATTRDLDRTRGRMSAIGDIAILQAQKEEITGKIALLSKQFDAITLALTALSTANTKLHARFSPKLNFLAGKIMEKLTNNKYSSIFVGNSMDVQTQYNAALISPLQLSSGTLDQLNLSVRLAVSNLVLSSNCPIVLDDALVYFDEKRGQTALQYLSKLGIEKQVILFTCHSRENTWI